jgi:hypothetical protein
MRYGARGTLGISRDVPIGAQEIMVVADLQTDADDKTLAKVGRADGAAQPASITIRSSRRR